MRAGLMRIAAIHRGFATSQPGIYRNEPLWRIPLELRRRLPSLPIICDPSHLCGSTDLIFSIAQEALDLLFDGLMIEVHADPPHALSDARQQLTPAQFGELLASLRVKSREPADSSIKSEIEHLRREIDALDTGLVELLAHRMEIVRRIGALKRKNAVAVFQPERWEEIVKTRLDANAASSLDRQFLLEVLELIHEEAIRQQTLPAPDGAEAGSGGTAK
jgi:chorismate mutase